MNEFYSEQLKKKYIKENLPKIKEEFDLIYSRVCIDTNKYHIPFTILLCDGPKSHVYRFFTIGQYDLYHESLSYDFQTKDIFKILKNIFDFMGYNCEIQYSKINFWSSKTYISSFKISI